MRLTVKKEGEEDNQSCVALLMLRRKTCKGWGVPVQLLWLYKVPE